MKKYQWTYSTCGGSDKPAQSEQCLHHLHKATTGTGPAKNLVIVHKSASASEYLLVSHVQWDIFS